MKTFLQFIESAHVSKKLLKNPPSGVSDMNKQNTGWRARMTWIQNEPKSVNDWWNRDKPKAQKGMLGFKTSNKTKEKKAHYDHSMQREIDLGKAIREKK